MTKFALRKEQHKAEILWALKCLMSHFLFNSTDITDIFKAIFPDSAIAHKMRFGPHRLSYLICFWHCTIHLATATCETERNTCFVILFDESLNIEYQNEHMDFFVKYFNKDRVVCSYLTSKFLGNTCGEEALKKEFEEGIQVLEMKKMAEVSMDGPNVNCKLYDSIVEERSQNDDCLALSDIGSHSLHVVHGVFRSGVQKAK